MPILDLVAFSRDFIRVGFRCSSALSSYLGDSWLVWNRQRQDRKLPHVHFSQDEGRHPLIVPAKDKVYDLYLKHCQPHCIGVPAFKAFLRQAENLLDKTVHVSLAGHQRDALLSLLVDIVSGSAHGNGVRFEESMLLAALNENEFQIAASQFVLFSYRGKRVDSGLWAKRNAEQLLFRRGGK